MSIGEVGVLMCVWAGLCLEASDAVVLSYLHDRGGRASQLN